MVLRASRFNALKHLRIDGGFIMHDEEFQIARRFASFRLREPADQFVKLLLAHNISACANSVFDACNPAIRTSAFYTRQRLQRGLDDSILGLNAVSRAVSRMADVVDSKRASCAITVEKVPAEETSHYGILQPEADSDDVFRVVSNRARIS
jgi:hypothetical protein